MKHYLSQQYRNTVCKYKKFKTRFEKNVEQGVSAKKRRTLAQRLKKLYDQIVRLETQLKWAVSAGALSLALSAVPTAQTFAQQDKFKYVERPFDFPSTGFVQTDSPVYPTFADLDGDGDLDLVLGLAGGGALFYQRNIDDNGKPVFELISNNDIRSPFYGVAELNDYSYLSPSFADMDGDGDLDMIVGYGDNKYGYVTLFKNADGKFVPFTGTANPFIAVQTEGGLGIGGARGEMIDIGDDGDLDLFVSGNNDDKYEIIVRYYENEDVNSGSFAQRVGAENPLDAVSITNAMIGSYYAAYGALTFADVDGDDDLDAYIGEKYGSVYEYKNNGDNTFAAGAVRPDLSFTFDYRAITPAFNDLDEDGDLDCLYGDKYYESLPFALNNGSNSFTITTDVNTATDFSVVNALSTLILPNMSGSAAADLDGDGDIDFVTLDFNGVIRYFTNNGDGSFEEVTVGSPFAIASSTTYISTFDLADFDKDGDFDLVLKDYYTNTPIYYTNTGSATAPAFTLAVTNPFASISVVNFASIQLVDFDADSDLDVLMGDGTQIRYFQNTGSGFTELTGTANPFDAINTKLAATTPTFKGLKAKLFDVDNDGDLDLLFGVFNNLEDPTTTVSPDFPRDKIYYYQNKEGVFEEVGAADTPFNMTVNRFADITLADLDGDEDLDLLLGELGAARLRYFERAGNNFCPKLEEIRLRINTNQIYEFVKEEFRDVYSDEPDTKNKDFPKIKIFAAPSFGTLTVGGSVISSGTELAYASLDNLVYTPNNGYTGIDAFAWGAFDPVGQCYSSVSYVRFGIGVDVTGLDELNKLVGIYPNPSNGLFNINLDKSMVGKVDIQVYNALGAVVRSYNYNNPNEVEAIDLQAMPKGLYIVRISNQGKDGTIKIVKE